MQANRPRPRVPSSYPLPPTSLSGGAGKPASLFSPDDKAPIVTRDEKPSLPVNEVSSKSSSYAIWLILVAPILTLLYLIPHATKLLLNAYIVSLRSDLWRLLFWLAITGGIACMAHFLEKEEKENVPSTKHDTKLSYLGGALLWCILARTVDRHFALQNVGCHDPEGTTLTDSATELKLWHSIAWLIWSGMIAWLPVVAYEDIVEANVGQFLMFLVLALPNIFTSGWRVTLLAFMVFASLIQMSRPITGKGSRGHLYHLARLNCRAATICFVIDLVFGCTWPRTVEAWISQVVFTVLFGLFTMGYDQGLREVAKKHGFAFT